MKERIAKRIATAGLCSRREAERWIESGRVAVNGQILSSPAVTVSAEDRVVVDGQLLENKPEVRLWRYYKPVGLVTTASDPQGRPTVFENLPRTMGRVISVGRLDLNSEGLLLLTNSGALARQMELPVTGLLRRYRVRVHGAVDEDRLAALAAGITVEGMRYAGIEARILRRQTSNCWLEVTLREGKNREIRKVMAALGLSVNRLIREGYGPFLLGELKPGEVQEVPTRDLPEVQN